MLSIFYKIFPHFTSISYLASFLFWNIGFLLQNRGTALMLIFFPSILNSIFDNLSEIAPGSSSSSSSSNYHGSPHYSSSSYKGASNGSSNKGFYKNVKGFPTTRQSRFMTYTGFLVTAALTKDQLNTNLANDIANSVHTAQLGTNCPAAAGVLATTQNNLAASQAFRDAMWTPRRLLLDLLGGPNSVAGMSEVRSFAFADVQEANKSAGIITTDIIKKNYE